MTFWSFFASKQIWDNRISHSVHNSLFKIVFVLVSDKDLSVIIFSFPLAKLLEFRFNWFDALLNLCFLNTLCDFRFIEYYEGVAIFTVIDINTTKLVAIFWIIKVNFVLDRCCCEPLSSFGLFKSNLVAFNHVTNFEVWFRVRVAKVNFRLVKTVEA